MTKPTSADSRDKPLRKSPSSLAIVPVVGKLTSLSRKLWSVLLHKAQEQGINQQVHRAPLAQIIGGLDFNSNDIELVKHHFHGLMATVLDWSSPTKGETLNWSGCTMLAGARLFEERGSIWAEWSYAPQMRDELLDPAVFAKLDIKIITQLSTHSAQALYEICGRYKDIGKTSREDWHWWVHVLSGRSDKAAIQKMEYRNFKRDTLRPTLAQVNAVSGIPFSIALVEHKEGRFVKDIQFTMQKTAQPSLNLIDAREPVDLSLFAYAMKLGITNASADSLAQEFGTVALKVGLMALEKRVATSFPEPLNSPTRYLKSMMPGHAQALVKEQVKVELSRTPEAIAVATKERTALWAQQWSTERNKQITEEIKALPKFRQDELTLDLLEEFKLQGAAPALITTLVNKGWWHNLVRAKMLAFYAAGAHGESWNKPTTEQVLDVAAREVVDPSR